MVETYPQKSVLTRNIQFFLIPLKRLNKTTALTVFWIIALDEEVLARKLWSHRLYIYVTLLIVALRYLHIIKAVFEPLTPRVDLPSIRCVNKTPVGDMMN